ncbi:hypothetical protein Pan216_05450 [Planctomycetes bacterium Pan216]|uniref:Uncharacterized protein n=1 Tax=Kolteria novifilia TaxID=2527975 RepID=A0A518AYB3_9BACT|nr:hypothetical protein Pan216_05450 [Planctomycetes bacterium Pan216]
MAGGSHKLTECFVKIFTINRFPAALGILCFGM